MKMEKQRWKIKSWDRVLRKFTFQFGCKSHSINHTLLQGRRNCQWRNAPSNVSKLPQTSSFLPEDKACHASVKLLELTLPVESDHRLNRLFLGGRSQGRRGLFFWLENGRVLKPHPQYQNLYATLPRFHWNAEHPNFDRSSCFEKSSWQVSFSAIFTRSGLNLS